MVSKCSFSAYFPGTRDTDNFYNVPGIFLSWKECQPISNYPQALFKAKAQRLY